MGPKNSKPNKATIPGPSSNTNDDLGNRFSPTKSEKEKKSDDNSSMDLQSNPLPKPKKQVLSWENVQRAVIGLDDAKQALDSSFFLPRKHPRFFQTDKEHQQVCSIMLWGPPGTGKTLLAESFADAHNAQLLKLSPSVVLSKYVGESERAISKLFNDAQQEKTVLFIDEIDSFGRKRYSEESEHSRTLKTQLLLSMDAFLKSQASVNGKDSILMACTNTLDELDDAIKRRFQLNVFCGLPDESQKVEMIKFYCSNFPNDLSDRDIKEIAKETELYSGSDIKRLVEKAKFGPAQELFDATHFIKNPEGFYEPCSADNLPEQAEERALSSLPDNSLACQRRVSMNDFRGALKACSATLTQKEYDRFLAMKKVDPKEAAGNNDESGVKRLQQHEREQLRIIAGENLEDLKDDRVKIFDYRVFPKQLLRCETVLRSPNISQKLSGKKYAHSVVWFFLAFLLLLWFPKLLWVICSIIAMAQLASVLFAPLMVLISEFRNNQDTDAEAIVHDPKFYNLLLSAIIAVILSMGFCGHVLNATGIKFIDNLFASFVCFVFMELGAQLTMIFSILTDKKMKKVCAMARYSIHLPDQEMVIGAPGMEANSQMTSRFERINPQEREISTHKKKV